MADTFTLPIQRVVAGAFTAWLVEDHSVPVVSLAWAWPGGAATDATGREGTAAMAAAMLTEGAGDMPALAFADALRDAAIGLSFSAGRDAFDGSFRCLTDALPEALRLARLAMTAPRMDADALERVRARAIAGARTQLETPRGQAGRHFWAAAFPGHPAGRPAHGTAESLAAIPPEALREALAAQLRRGGLLVAAAGAIRPAELARVMEDLFGSLPAGAPATPPALPAFTAFGREVVPVPGPQSQVVFGQPGIAPDSPDWETAQVVLRVLGGGGFSSRLMEAVRVQRGLTYGIGVGLDTLFGGGVVTGGFATENGKVAEALQVTRDVWADLAQQGPTEAELEEAVAYLTGSLPLQFTDSRRIAATLLAMQRNKRAIDWLDGRNARLRAITRADAARVATSLLQPEALAVTVAGQPVGL
ncbi:insulinase family protein [Roseomonas sp. HJA6]|uniref:Insulinase family protein n=1 Tax=Roseomonas alba TaxID=2846776 RepID=A0ABS7AGP1_9PROT|nr:pitrilysin family protein [Neoroseomonas alba]MBW6401474.1 insulinase family protein [Neoroseomonas alba]